MTEAEWLACADPVKLITPLEGRCSDRKCLLFAIAGCYLVAPLKKPKAAFETVVKYADREIDIKPLRKQWGRAFTQSWIERPFQWVYRIAIDSLNGEIEYPPVADLVPLVRDIFGNPFRPVPFSPSWRTSTAVAIASQMYESRDFSAMPILADALQGAGCDSADVLDHCRGPGPHVRGCWVVDLVLGKE